MFKSKLLTNSQTITLPTYRFSDQNMSKRGISLQSNSFPPKKTLSGGEEISLGDLTVPPKPDRNSKLEMKTKKTTLAIPPE